MPEGPRLSPALREFLAGELIDGKFRVVRKISAGAFGNVYEVIQLPFERSVALKLLNRDTLGNEKQIKRFQREAKAASSFQHPNLASVYEYGFLEEGPAYIAMQLVEGEPLSVRTRLGGRYIAEDALKIFAQAASGLASAHLNEVIHRDIKPENLLLTTDENGELTVKLVDFGLARPIGDWAKHTQKLTQLGQTVGTPAYMSPEQCMAKTVDERSDIYSLGCTMYEAVSGEPPFTGATALDTMHQQIRAQPKELQIAGDNQDMAQRLADIIYKCLQKKPSSRYASAAELLSDIETVSNGGVPIASQDSLVRPSKAQPTAIDLASRLRRFNPLTASAIFLGALLAVSFATALLLQSVRPEVLDAAGFWQSDLLNRLDNRPGLDLLVDGRTKHFALQRRPLPATIAGIFLVRIRNGKFAAIYKGNEFKTPIKVADTAHTLTCTPSAVYVGEEDTVREFVPNPLMDSTVTSSEAMRNIPFLGTLGSLRLDPQTQSIAASGWISATRGSLVGASVSQLINGEFRPLNYMKIETTHMYADVTFGPNNTLWSWIDRPDGCNLYSQTRRDDRELIQLTAWDLHNRSPQDASMWDQRLRSRVAFANKRISLPCPCKQMCFSGTGELWITTGTELWRIDMKKTEVTIHPLPPHIEVIDLQLSNLPPESNRSSLVFINRSVLA